MLQTLSLPIWPRMSENPPWYRIYNIKDDVPILYSVRRASNFLKFRYVASWQLNTVAIVDSFKGHTQSDRNTAYVNRIAAITRNTVRVDSTHQERF